MEALPKQTQGVLIDVDGEEEKANQTDNEKQEGSRCSSSSTETAEIIKESGSSVSETCLVEGDLEFGVTETKLHLAKVERDCRICHLSLEPTNQESGVPMELGCSCKNDLAAAHKQCAEAWFKIKGNSLNIVHYFQVDKKLHDSEQVDCPTSHRCCCPSLPTPLPEATGDRTCEICGSTARNVAAAKETDMTEQWNEANDSTAAAPVTIHAAESQNFWQGHRFVNFLLGCMVFAFIISWLFHFNVPS